MNFRRAESAELPVGEAEAAGDVHPGRPPAVESGGVAFGEGVVGEQGACAGQADLAAVGVAGEVEVWLEVERGPADQERVVAQDHPQTVGPFGGMPMEDTWSGVAGAPSAEADDFQRHAGDLPPLVVHEHHRCAAQVANELGTVMVAGDGVGTQRGAKILEETKHRRQRGAVIDLVLHEVAGAEDDLGAFSQDLRDRVVEDRLPPATQVDIGEMNQRESVEGGG